MIWVEARILKNEMVLNIEGKEILVKPSGWNQKGITGALKRAFTLKYEILDEKNNVVCVVRYNDLKDEIFIQRGIEKYQTISHMFHPHEFKFKSKNYKIHEKMIGTISIMLEDKVIAEGKCGFKRVTFSKYDSNLKEILGELAVGYCIKMLVWHMYI